MNSSGAVSLAETIADLSMTPSGSSFSPSAAFERVGARSVEGVQLAEAAVIAWLRLTADQRRWAVEHFSYQQMSDGLKAENFCRWCLDQPYA
jgi:hypothetical protein